jgi:hypothetical protein
MELKSNDLNIQGGAAVAPSGMLSQRTSGENASSQRRI